MPTLFNFRSRLPAVSVLFWLMGFLICFARDTLGQVYSTNFNSNANDWILRPSGSSTSWNYSSANGVSSTGCIKSTETCASGSGNAVDSNYYAASPMMTLTAGNTYRVTVKCSVATANTRKAVVGINTHRYKSGSTQLTNFGYVATGSYTTFTYNFSVGSTGSYCLLFWGEKYTTQTVNLYMDDFSVTLLNTPPTCSISNPTNGTTFDEGDDDFFLFWASASDAESNLSKVEFYVDGSKVGEKTTPAYRIICTTGVGTHILTAKATDSYGANTTSAASTITIRARPHITSVTIPEEGETYPEGALTFSLDASDADGTVSAVDFYVDYGLVGTDSTSPFSMNWTATPGTHTFSATATDNDGLGSFELFELPFGVVANTCSILLPTTHKQSICSGDSLKLKSIKGTAFAQTLQWQRKPTGGSFSNISGATDTVYRAKLEGVYRAIWTFTNAATCTTGVDTVVVNPLPIPASDTIYHLGGQPIVVYARATAGTAPYAFSWTYSDTCFSPHCDTAAISGFASALYLTATDAVGCSTTIEVPVKEAVHNDNFLIGNIIGNMTDSEFSEAMSNAEALFQEFMKETKSGASVNLGRNSVQSNSSDILFVPVVVKILADASVQSQIENAEINVMIDRINSFYGLHPVTDHHGRSKKIQLCYAHKNGTQTINPITRTTDPVTGGDPSTIDFIKKPSGEWIPDSEDYYQMMNEAFSGFSYKKFMRIIIVQKMQKVFKAPPTPVPPPEEIHNIDAFSFYPSRHALYIGGNDDPQNYDGVFIHYRVVNGLISNSNPALAVAHEVGHFFDVYHPFEHEGTDYCNSEDAEAANTYYSTAGVPTWDFVKDTPPKNGEWGNSGLCTNVSGLSLCESPPPTNANEILQQTRQNLMDYGPRVCVVGDHALTGGQLDRMYYAALFYRSELWSFDNAMATGIECALPLAAINVTSTTHLCGTNPTVSVEHSPTPSGTQWSGEWLLNGGSIASTDISISGNTATITVQTEGVVTLTWKLTNSTNSTLNRESSIDLYVSPTCIGSGDHKKNVFFGDQTGISFGSGNPMPIPNATATLHTPFLNQNGTLVAYNDASGNLKFYSDGITLWNSTGYKVNSSADLQGQVSSSQAGIALPDPGDAAFAYLITVSNTNGIRSHKIKLADIQGSSPNPNTSTWNVGLTSGGPPTTSGTGNSIRTANKITAIKIPESDDYWVISQGPHGVTDWGNRLYFFRLSSSGLVFDHYQEAGVSAPDGILAVSPSGQYMVNTFTEISSTLGYGINPVNSKLYNLYPQGGTVIKSRNLTIPVVTASSLGASFDAGSEYLYTFVNRAPSISGSDQTNYAGIYSYDLLNCGEGALVGLMVSLKPYGTCASNGLMLGPDKKIYISKAIDPAVQAFLTSMNSGGVQLLAKNGHDVGVIHFPGEADVEDKGLEWEAVALTSTMKSRSGLGNFIDATNVDMVDLSGEYEIDLGDNPIYPPRDFSNPCCSQQRTLHISRECAMDVDNDGKKEIVGKFRMRRIGGSFKYLRVHVSDDDFPIVAKLDYYNNAGPQTIQNLSTSGTFYAAMDDDDVLGYSGYVLNVNPGADFVDFILKVEATNTAESGFFKILIFTTLPANTSYNLLDEQSFPDLLHTCCRKAVTPESNAENGWKPVSENQHKSSSLALVPNPATHQVSVLWNGGDAEIEILDAIGRKVARRTVSDESSVFSTADWPTGLYKVNVYSQGSRISKSLQIIH